MPIAADKGEYLVTADVPDNESLRAIVHRLSVDQYHRMARLGILCSGEPVELLSGILVRKMLKNPRHRIALNHLRDLLLAIPIDDFHLQIQDPITTDDSEPVPDLSIVQGTTDDYSSRHPEPHEVALVIEVADSSLYEDRNWKQSIYARNRIPEYWIVNLINCQVEVYTDPRTENAPGYAFRRVFTPGQTLTLTLAGREIGQIAVSSVLP